jgi:hypothetical protein
MNCADLASSRPMPPQTIRRPASRRRTDALNALVWVGALVGVVLAHGCAGIERASQPETPPQAAPVATTVAVEPKAAAAGPPTPPKAAQPASTADKVTQTPVVPSASTAQGASNAAAAPPKPRAKPAEAPPAAVSPKQQAAAPLDLKSLETRLKETPAIGVFTKVTLKNQIDALLDRFRAFHQGKLKESLPELRRSYDMLVLKVLALLQDADPPLASAIAASREAIWGILSNPAKFASV